jgi:membrane protein implicated in regulation of membrane protease activity
MPIWFTVAIGVAGAIAAGLLSQLLFDDPNGGFLLALVAAIVIVIGYRRFAQGRGITGPAAKRRPIRGVGVRQDLDEKLAELHDAGLLTEEELEAKRVLLRSRV